MNKALVLPKGIVIESKVRFGKPVIAGTRIAISDILSLIEAGYSIDEIPGQYQTVTIGAAKKALRYATDLLGKEEILTIST